MAEVNNAAEAIASEFVSKEHILELKEELLAAIHEQESNYSWFFAILLFGLIVGTITGLKKYLIDYFTKKAKKSDNKIDDAFFDIINQWTQPYVVISFAAFAATYVYPINVTIDLVAKLTFLCICTWRILRSLEYSVLFVAGEWVFEHSKAGDNLEANFRKALRICLYTAGFIFISDNIGLNISSLVAGLGIGGLAVALAAQAVLGDTIASVALFMDQPFKVGDAVTINGHDGVIEKIGFKTTKLRANSGELVVYPNSVVSSATIQNYARAIDARMNQNTTVKIHNGTDTHLVQQIPNILFEALKEHEEFTPTELYLIGFGDCSIDFEIRYSVANASPVTCRAALGKINQIVLRVFRENNINSPVPKTSVDLHQNH